MTDPGRRRLFLVGTVAAVTALGCTAMTDGGPPAVIESAESGTTVPSTTTSTDSTTDSSDAETTASADPCDVLAGQLDAAHKTGSADDAESAIAALADVLDDLQADATSAPPDVRELAEQIGQLYDFYIEGGGEVVEIADDSGNAEVIDLVDELVTRTHALMLHPASLYGLSELRVACPDTYAEIEDDYVNEPAPNPRRLVSIDDRLTELGFPDLVDDYLPPGTLEMIERDVFESESDRQDEFDDCIGDVGARSSGDNEGCDAMYDACDGRDLLACNDLFWASQLGSEYEEFGATCGGRTMFGAIGYGGFCHELE